MKTRGPSAIVLGLYLPGIDVLKDFHARGISCVGVDVSADSPGFGLRSIPVVRCPDPENEQAQWLACLLALVDGATAKPVLVITSDRFILPVLGNAAALEPHFVFHHSRGGITERVMNKRRAVEAARECGIPVPKTIALEDMTSAGGIEFPCVIRPELGTTWKSPPLKHVVGGNKAIRVENRAELERWLEKITPYDRNLIIQEVVPGPDENLFYLVVYFDRNSRCTGYFCGQKLRTVPIHFGSASYMRTTDPGPLLPYARSLLGATGYHGPAGVEFKRDSRDGSFRLIEVNARFGLWDIMAHRTGIDLFHQAYLDLTGEDVTPQVPRPVTWYWLALSREVRTWRAYRREGLLTFGGWLKSLFGRVHIADVYWDEPGVMYRLHVLGALRKVRRKVLGPPRVRTRCSAKG